jgi:hypothetical protein
MHLGKRMQIKIENSWHKTTKVGRLNLLKFYRGCLEWIPEVDEIPSNRKTCRHQKSLK